MSFDTALPGQAGSAGDRLRCISPAVAASLTNGPANRFAPSPIKPLRPLIIFF